MDQAKTNMQNSVNSKIEEADNRISELQNFETQLEQIESKNIEQDNRLKDVEYKNKVQDVYVSGLFNENNDKRLTIEGEGNSLKLEGSKKGLVEVDKVVGDTMVNIMPNIDLTMPNVNNGTVLDYYGKFVPLVQNNKTYTLKIFNNPCITEIYITMYGMSWTALTNDCATFTVNYTNYNSEDARNIQFKTTRVLTANELSNLKIVLVEGNIPPIEYFEGIQSSFEDCKVTQEMVDSGEESVENLGKYKCNVKIRGKNLFDGKLESGWVGADGSNSVMDRTRTDYICIKSNTSYTISIDTKCSFRTMVFDSNKNVLSDTGNLSNFTSLTMSIPSNGAYIRIMWAVAFETGKNYNAQIEEGTQATPYEPYFSRTQTVYLNSPPHKGDEIVAKEDGLYHYHYRNIKTFQGKDEEGWFKYNIASSAVDTFAMYTTITDMYYTGSTDIINDVICDKLQTYQVSSIYSGKIGIAGGGSYNRIYISTPITNAENLDQYKACLQSDPITVNYKLKEPYFEKISDDKLLLEIPNSATLSVESVIPCTSIKATYTGNVPSVYGLEETGITNTNDIAVTQTAVDFLLMSSMGEVMMMSFNENTRGGNNMGAYFASRIMKKALKYEDVIRKYPEFKEDIDFILRSEGYGDLIVEAQ